MTWHALHRPAPLQTTGTQDLQGNAEVPFTVHTTAVGGKKRLQGDIRQREAVRLATSRMPQAGAMAQPPNSPFHGRCIGITGARGALGQALIRRFSAAGAEVIGFSHGTPPADNAPDGLSRWQSWSCGEEAMLASCLEELDVLVLNHGINPQGGQDPDTLTRTLEINALSCWRLMQSFEKISRASPRDRPRELWINTSEAEIQPAASPAYELSKRLLGQLVSIRGAVLDAEGRQQLILRKLVLGPFRSSLNPIGVMGADFVAAQILNQVRWGARLVIVTPNPLTYVVMPLSELMRRIYSRILNHPDR